MEKDYNQHIEDYIRFDVSTRKYELIVEPPEMDVTPFVQSDELRFGFTGGVLQEFHLPDNFYFYKDNFPMIKYYGKVGLVSNAPSKIIIKVKGDNLKFFSWHNVPIVVFIDYKFNKTITEKGIYMTFLNKNAKEEIKKILIDPKAWSEFKSLDDPELYDPNGEYNREIKTDTTFSLGDYWNMTYYFRLPRHSVKYDFWLTVRGIESEKKDFEIEFYVDDIKITEENFIEMTKKYPELLIEDPIGRVQ